LILKKENSQLLVVDIQEKLVSVMHESEKLIKNSLVLIESANELDLPIIFSTQYPKGLGNLHPAIVGFTSCNDVFEKSSFSCSEDNKINDSISHKVNLGYSQLIIFGIELHICVLQSALEFKQKGFEVHVVVDATSSRKKESIDFAVTRLVANDINIVTTEMAIFEWLKYSGTDKFKKLSRLVK